MDNVAQINRIRIVFGIVFQIEFDVRAVALSFRRGDFISVHAVGRPQISLVAVHPLGRDFHFGRHHKRRIKPDAEFADKVNHRGIVLGVLQKLRRAGFGDGADVVDKVVAVHADTVVGNSQRIVVFVRRNRDFIRRVAFGQVGVGQPPVFQFIQRVRRVGNQLAQKDVFFRIKRIDNNVQKFVDFGLKLYFFSHFKVLPQKTGSKL